MERHYRHRVGVKAMSSMHWYSMYNGASRDELGNIQEPLHLQWTCKYPRNTVFYLGQMMQSVYFTFAVIHSQLPKIL